MRTRRAPPPTSRRCRMTRSSSQSAGPEPSAPVSGPTRAADLVMPRIPVLVVFDLSGTTVEDRGQVPAAFTAAFARAGLVVNAQHLQAARGATKRQAILTLVPEGP